MKILAIETSCDETAIAIVEKIAGEQNPLFNILANVLHSQIDVHKDYGGVFPALAKREHARILTPLLIKALRDAQMYQKAETKEYDTETALLLREILQREPELLEHILRVIPKIRIPAIDAIAVTEGPGLEPALWVGINFARTLALLWNKPVIAVNHMEGHLFSSLITRKNNGATVAIEPFQFPLISLLVSGGHTEIILAFNWGKYEIIGETQDDAVGEAFDKVARLLDLPYPGGPQISRIARTGTAKKYPLPRPMLHAHNYNFSFSGLKTAVLYLIKQISPLSDQQKADIAREFEDACVDVLVEKTIRAAEEYGAQTITLGGGVSANKALRDRITAEAKNRFPQAKLFLPEPQLSTDNALMIAISSFLDGIKLQTHELHARGHWRIAERKP